MLTYSIRTGNIRYLGKQINIEIFLKLYPLNFFIVFTENIIIRFKQLDVCDASVTVSPVLHIL